MYQYIKRMVTGKEDLEGKLKKVSEALRKSDEIHLDKTQAVLLQNQFEYMKQYNNVLKERIEYEKKLHGEF